MFASRIRILLFSLIFLIGFFICVSALVYDSYHPIDNKTYISINSIFLSKYVRDSAVTGLAISIPILVELIDDYITSKKLMKTEDLVARSLVVMLLFMPNLAIFLFIFTIGGPITFLFIQYFSSLLYVLVSFYYLSAKGNIIWGESSTIILSLCYTIAASLGYWTILYPSLNLSTLKSVLYTISTIFIVRNTLRWILYIKKTRKLRSLSFHEKCCNIYILAIFTIGALSWVVYIIKVHGPDLTYCLPNYVLSCVAIMINIIYGKKAKQESELSQQALEIKRMFVRYVSHEIRTPLNTVFIGLKLLKQEIHKMTVIKNNITDNTVVAAVSLIQTVDDIQISCNISLEILNDLLLFDKIETGILILDKSNTNIRKLLHETVQSFNIQAREGQISLIMIDQTIEAYPHHELILSIDPYKLKQVIRNLVSNALKFTLHEGKVTVTLSIVEVEEPTRDPTSTSILLHRRSLPQVVAIRKMLQIKVEDTGYGIAEENQHKLFKNIIQFSPGTLQNGQGTGLGLFISHGIMLLHDGDLTVYSEGVGHGTSFSATLPFLPITSEPMSVSVSVSVTPMITEATDNKTELREVVTDMSECNSQHRKQVSNRLKIMGRQGSQQHEYYEEDLNRIKYPHQNDDDDNKPCDKNIDEISEDMIFMKRDNDNDYDHDNDCDDSQLGEMSSCSYSTSLPRLPSYTNLKGSRPLSLQSVLVVDDAPLNRKMLSRLLQSKFHRVNEVEDGQYAVDFYKTAKQSQENIDIILMDYQMPRLDGPSAASALRGLGYTGLIVGVTGNAVQKDLETFIENGANFVMTKPLDWEALEAKLINHI